MGLAFAFINFRLDRENEDEADFYPYWCVFLGLVNTGGCVLSIALVCLQKKAFLLSIIGTALAGGAILMVQGLIALFLLIPYYHWNLAEVRILLLVYFYSFCVTGCCMMLLLVMVSCKVFDSEISAPEQALRLFLYIAFIQLVLGNFYRLWRRFFCEEDSDCQF